MKPRKLRKAHRGGALRAVVDETIALFHRLRFVAEKIYGEDGRSTARRGVLRGIVRYGPQTVPELAKTRSVKRQSIQEVVNALVDSGLAVLVPNPKSARSPRVQATEQGIELVRTMDEIDARVLAVIGRSFKMQDLDVTARTLRALRESFERTSPTLLV